eukprot:gene11313-15175_t
MFMLLFVVLLFAAFQIEVVSIKLYKLNSWQRRCISVGITASSLYISPVIMPQSSFVAPVSHKNQFSVSSNILNKLVGVYPAYADDVTIIPATTLPTSNRLTATEVLSIDREPKISILKDIYIVFQSYPSFAENKDYISLRQSLREEPTVQLRKTCRKLEKYLSTDELPSFQRNYGEMIDAVGSMDLMALRRMQGENVPSKDEQDKEFIAIVNNAIDKYKLMLNVISPI